MEPARIVLNSRHVNVGGLRILRRIRGGSPCAQSRQIAGEREYPDSSQGQLQHPAPCAPTFIETTCSPKNSFHKHSTVGRAPNSPRSADCFVAVISAHSSYLTGTSPRP